MKHYHCKDCGVNNSWKIHFLYDDRCPPCATYKLLLYEAGLVKEKK